jgi:hypothetical protein
MRRKSCFAGRLPDPKTASASPSSAPMTSRFEGARRSKLAALQLLFVLHRRAAPLLFSSVNALNVTTMSWVTIQLVAPYDLLIVIRASCCSRM